MATYYWGDDKQIDPFGTSTNFPTITGGNNKKALKQIKAFGCTVVNFNVSADWSSQAGKLDLTLIEDEADGDRLKIPVIGSPFLFELREDDGSADGKVIFEYLGLVDSFARSATNASKTYTCSFASPLKILEATKVILSGYTGMGGSGEGFPDFSGFGPIDFGHNNNEMIIDDNTGAWHWFNVSNLINAFGILENDDPFYRVPRNDSRSTNPFFGNLVYGDFGRACVNEDGMPLAHLMWALHMGINHLPKLDFDFRQRTHGGNLLYGRHNYNLDNTFEGIPYFYDFDALAFYNQVKDILGPQYRIGGESKSINSIINEICNEANLEYYAYIDIDKNNEDGDNFGDQTLQDFDPNWSKSSNCAWPNLDERKFTEGGKYGGTIRIRTISKNSFFNPDRPFSNIAYSLLGLEVPDLDTTVFSESGKVHPGKRPQKEEWGIAGPDVENVYMDPLDSAGLDDEDDGMKEVGTRSVAGGGDFPTITHQPDGTYIFDNAQMDYTKLASSNISLTASDAVTMKVVTGGFQSRMVHVPRSLIRCYWGELSLIGRATDPRVTNTPTDEYGLNENSVRKIPVVTQQLDPRDTNDFILIDIQSIFGNSSIPGFCRTGVYAASMLEIRMAMAGFDQWLSYLRTHASMKYWSLFEWFEPGIRGRFAGPLDFGAMDAATETLNGVDGLGYEGVSDELKCTNSFYSLDTSFHNYTYGLDADGKPKDALDPGLEGDEAEGFGRIPSHIHKAFKDKVLSKLHEIVKNIGDQHYGKSWYVPIPYFKTKEDLDGNNLVGDFVRSWDLEDSAYVEPINYYPNEIPQSNQFISDGKVSAFVNYDNDFIFGSTSEMFSDTYINDLANPINGVIEQVYNFSEYSMDELCFTQYGSRSIKHAAPEKIEDKYSFIPYAYDYFYNRSLIPATNIDDGSEDTYPSDPHLGIDVGAEADPGYWDGVPDEYRSGDPVVNYTEGDKTDTGADVDIKVEEMLATNPLIFDAIDNLASLAYPDNGEFCFPFLKVTTSRVFMPVLANEKSMDKTPDKSALQAIINNTAPPSLNMLGDPKTEMMKPFPVCICPRSINYPQRSTRYVYGPWITSIDTLIFRGNIEYEQDDSLLPENFLIPLNFGAFGDFDITQISGLTGMSLAAQGRANAIDDFALFAQEQGTVTVQGAPAIYRIGDLLYNIGALNVTDLKVSVNNASIQTSYSFKTISPRIGRNNRDVEKRLTKISNEIKKLKLR